MSRDIYRTTRDPATGVANSCIDLVYSPDDGGWYAQEYNFLRRNNATRTSRKIYSARERLVIALDSGAHNWEKWS